jgi:hypothetical protein
MKLTINNKYISEVVVWNKEIMQNVSEMRNNMSSMTSIR